MKIIKSWFIDGSDRIHGETEDGKFIITSPIKSEKNTKDYNVFTTQSGSEYKVFKNDINLFQFAI